jgi:alpha-N-arabinofuranosidase
MELYNVHQDAVMLPVKVVSNNYTMGTEKLQAVSVSASKDAAGITHISLVNIDAAKAQDLSINISGSSYTSVTGSIITSKKLQDYNSFEEPNKIHPVEFKEVKLSGNSLNVKLPPFSVVVLTLK